MFLQCVEKFIDYLSIGKLDRSKSGDARNIRSASTQFQLTIRILVIEGALESLSVNEHDEGS